MITRALGLGDLRAIGSGNIGATNVLRTGNKGAAAATLLLDAAKGAVAVLLARHFAGETAAMVAGLFAFLGHLFPVWLRFRGGKGVATFLGVTLALAPWAGLLACAVWAGTAALFRFSSLAALAAAATAPIWLALTGPPGVGLAGLGPGGAGLDPPPRQYPPPAGRRGAAHRAQRLTGEAGFNQPAGWEIASLNWLVGVFGEDAGEPVVHIRMIAVEQTLGRAPALRDDRLECRDQVALLGIEPAGSHARFRARNEFEHGGPNRLVARGYLVL